MKTKTFDPDEVIGRMYLQDVDKNGERYCAKIIQKLIKRDKETQDARIKS